jgi:hypothetical protein
MMIYEQYSNKKNEFKTIQTTQNENKIFIQMNSHLKIMREIQKLMAWHSTRVDGTTLHHFRVIGNGHLLAHVEMLKI